MLGPEIIFYPVLASCARNLVVIIVGVRSFNFQDNRNLYRINWFVLLIRQRKKEKKLDRSL